MPEEPEISVAGPDDLDAVHDLIQGQFAEHAIEVAASTREAAIRAVLEDAGRGFFLLARVGGDVVGVAYVATTWTLEHGGASAWLEELYVVPTLRNRGIGRALVRAVSSVAGERGCAALDLEVGRDHARAETLYRREGFAPLERSRWVRRLATREGEA
jgi:GNAT superfamily N-acetyltransferase